MYDRDWARSIVENYQKLRTRAQQIDMCIQQLYQQETGRYVLRQQLKNILVDSVQGKCNKALWPDYKRLVRKTPLDNKLLKRVYNNFKWQIDVDIIQRQFDFS